MPPSQAALLAALREQFGHERFLPGQERVIRDLLNGRDVLAVLPTGGGKSLVYQLAAQFLPGTTIVVSPLLALMRDQVESLEEQGVEAGLVTSQQSEGEAREEMREVACGEAKLLYVTPERFDNEEFMTRLQRTTVSLFVVDEAHAISEWGHDFRPAYLALGDVVERLGRPVTLALTATATPWVRRDIAERLGLRNPDLVVHGVDRPNLFFEVLRADSAAAERHLLERLFDDESPEPPYGQDVLREALRGSGIIYTATTKAARETAHWLCERGIPADYYHGQRKRADRERVQDAFMDGDLRVIAATNAFGLGVDKPDIRFVIHLDVPASVEAYYQEAGRSGRDGQPARCVLIYSPADLGRAAFLAGGGTLNLDELRQLRSALRRQPTATRRELAKSASLGRADLDRAIRLLADQGILEERRGRVRLLQPDFDPAAIPLESEEHRRTYERSRLEMMRAYAELRECRRRYILNYFGQEYEAERCNWCDNDLQAAPASAGQPAGEHPSGTPPSGPFALNERVTHRAYGDGIVQRVTDDSITVLFDTAGYKTFDSQLVEEREILQSDED